MPLFEYRCTSCKGEFELLILHGAVPVCPSCGSTTLEKKLSMFAVTSDGTTLRNREKLGAQQRQKFAADSKEREHYKHDHHDD